MIDWMCWMAPRLNNQINRFFFNYSFGMLLMLQWLKRSIFVCVQVLMYVRRSTPWGGSSLNACLPQLVLNSVSDDGGDEANLANKQIAVMWSAVFLLWMKWCERSITTHTLWLVFVGCGTFMTLLRLITVQKWNRRNLNVRNQHWA